MLNALMRRKAIRKSSRFEEEKDGRDMVYMAGGWRGGAKGKGLIPSNLGETLTIDAQKYIYSRKKPIKPDEIDIAQQSPLFLFFFLNLRSLRASPPPPPSTRISLHYFLRSLVNPSSLSSSFSTFVSLPSSHFAPLHHSFLSPQNPAVPIF